MKHFLNSVTNSRKDNMANAEQRVLGLVNEWRAAKRQHSYGGYNWHHGSHNEEAFYRLMNKKNALIGVQNRLIKTLMNLISQIQKEH